MVRGCYFLHNVKKFGEGQHAIVVGVALNEDLPDAHANGRRLVEHGLTNNLQCHVEVHHHGVWVDVVVVSQVRMVAQHVFLRDDFACLGSDCGI